VAPPQPLILQLGRLVPRKGVDNVILSLPQLNRLRPGGARLLVVGGDAEVPDPERTPEIGRLQALARQEGLGDQVRFVGRRARELLKYYYSAADVFVTTPWYEPFGMTPLESMACGTPVLASAVGGLKFSVRHGDTGYLVPPRDPRALAERLGELLDRPPLAKRFRRRAVDHVNRYFTWPHVTRALITLYDRVTGRSGDRRVVERRRLPAAVPALRVPVNGGLHG